MAGHNEWSNVKRRNGALDLACDRQSCEFATVSSRPAAAGRTSPGFPAALVDYFKRSARTAVVRDTAIANLAFARAFNPGALEVPANPADHLLCTSRGQADAVGDTLKRGGLESDWIKLTRQPEVTVSRKVETTASQIFRRSGVFVENEHDQCADAQADIPDPLLVKTGR